MAILISILAIVAMAVYLQKKDNQRNAERVFDVLDSLKETTKENYYTKIAGINYREGIEDLDDNTFAALLVPEPTNPYDPDAIKVIRAEDSRLLGYISAKETQAVRDWVKNSFPYPCIAIISSFTEEDQDYDDEDSYDSTHSLSRTVFVGRLVIKHP